MQKLGNLRNINFRNSVWIGVWMLDGLCGACYRVTCFVATHMGREETRATFVEGGN